MNDLKCPRCGRDGHLPAGCDVPVLPDDRVLREKPEALRLADELLEPIEGFPSPTTLEKQAAALLRAQHAEIVHKAALLRQALEQMGQFSAIDICETQHHKKADQHSHIAQCPVAERFRAVWFAIKQELSQ